MKAICYDTGKVIFNTLGEASEAMATIRQIVNRKDEDGKRIKHRLLKPRPRRVYYCAHCDGYHLTSWNWWRLGTKSYLTNLEQKLKKEASFTI